MVNIATSISNHLSYSRGRLPSYMVDDVDIPSFDKQQDFIDCKDPLIVVCCSRRAGKSAGVRAKLRKAATQSESYDCLYITSTRQMAKILMWDAMIEDLRILGIRHEANISELTIKILDNGSTIRLTGASNKKDIDKVRGPYYKLVVIDEAQMFPDYLKTFCEEAILPALADVQGQLVLTGTPNEFSSGFFYDCCHSTEWKRFFWLWSDNPFFISKVMSHNDSLHGVDDILHDILRKQNKKITDPSVRREWFGEWCRSSDMFVYDYDKARNHFDALPDTKHPWSYVMGADLGFNDHDAIVVIGYPKYSKECYVVYEWKQNKVSIDRFAEQFKTVYDTYLPHFSVVDGGGLGKKIAESLSERFRINIHMAEKDRKQEYIALANSELRSSLIRISADGELAKEMRHLTWNKDRFDACKYLEEVGKDNHLCDAFLYAWRWAYHYMAVEDPGGPEPGSVAYQVQQIKKFHERKTRLEVDGGQNMRERRQLQKEFYGFKR